MRELPLAVELDVVLLIACAEPHRAIPVTHRERSEEIPDAGRAIAADVDDRIHHVMLRETDSLLEALEKFANRVVSLMPPDAGAFPNAVRREQRGDFRGIVILVANGAVACLEFLDRLDIFENRDPFFEVADIHRNPLCGYFSAVGRFTNTAAVTTVVQRPSRSPIADCVIFRVCTILSDSFHTSLRSS